MRQSSCRSKRLMSLLTSVRLRVRLATAPVHPRTSASKKVRTSMRELRCRDAGFDCDAVVQGESDDAVFAQAAPHAEQVHGLTVTPELQQQLAGLIHDA